MRKRFTLTLSALALAIALVAAPMTSYAGEGCGKCGGDKKEEKKDNTGSQQGGK